MSENKTLSPDIEKIIKELRDEFVKIQIQYGDVCYNMHPVFSSFTLDPQEGRLEISCNLRKVTGADGNA